MGVPIRLKSSETEPLVAALRKLTPDSHFHLMACFPGDEAEPGVADVEFSLQGTDEDDDVTPSYEEAKAA